MAINDIPQFFKRRFNQKEFDKYIMDAMNIWIVDHTDYGDFEINVINESIVEYFWDTYKFDFFGEEASHNYQNLSDEILANRKFLKEIMLQNNFRIFESEWWHYNLNGSNNDAVSNKKWRCEN